VNAKRKGSKQEHRSIKLLESMGYACTRAAASLGVFDIVAISPVDVILVQVKSNRWPDSAEMEQMKLFRAPPNCRKMIHRYRDRVRLPDVKEL
jgi:Holliday junction resolvase